MFKVSYRIVIVVLFAAVVTVTAFRSRHPDNAAAAGPTTQLTEQSIVSLIGKPAPEISLKTFDGKNVTLSQFKGKVVYIDLWSIHCPPCIVALRHINELSNDKARSAAGLVVWALHESDTVFDTGDPVAMVKPFVTKPGYQLTVPLDLDGKVGTAYNLNNFPSAAVIGRDGIIKYAADGADNTGEEAEQKLLAAIDRELAAK